MTIADINDNISVRYITLPNTVKGITVRDTDGFCNIYINDNISYDEQQAALQHELQHCLKSDFDKCSLNQCEMYVSDINDVIYKKL